MMMMVGWLVVKTDQPIRAMLATSFHSQLVLARAKKTRGLTFTSLTVKVEGAKKNKGSIGPGEFTTK